MVLAIRSSPNHATVNNLKLNLVCGLGSGCHGSPELKRELRFCLKLLTVARKIGVRMDGVHFFHPEPPDGFPAASPLDPPAGPTTVILDVNTETCHQPASPLHVADPLWPC